MDNKSKVIQYLQGRSSATALELSKHIFGKDATAANINPLLYEMKRESKIEQEPGKPPKWFLPKSVR
jgi:hypothetical protein